MPGRTREAQGDPEAEAAEAASQERFLRDHAFDRWKDDLNAMEYIEGVFELIKRVKNPTPDPGGQMFDTDRFNTEIDNLLENPKAREVLLAKHGGGATGLQFIRWIGGLDPESPLRRKPRGE